MSNRLSEQELQQLLKNGNCSISGDQVVEAAKKKRNTGMNRRNEHELQEQITFIDWVALNRQHAPNKEVRDAMELCYGTLNGVQLGKSQAGKAKASCAAKGIPDVNLDWPVNAYLDDNGDVFGLNSSELDVHAVYDEIICYGLRIEMKAGKNKLSEAQERKKELLEKAGYKYEVCYSAKAAIQAVVDYLPFGKKDYVGLDF